MIEKLNEIFSWRRLLFSLALKDIKTKYRQAAGGFAWMLILPLIQMVIFSFIFRFLFKIKIENYALFLLSGLFAWSFLRSSVEGAAISILFNANLIKKAYFPREILPISHVISRLINFLFSLIILFIFSLWSGIYLFSAIFWLPLVILIQIFLTIGISLFFASLNTRYRDAQFIMDVILTVLFYATPIVYSLEMVRNILPPALFFLYKLNPITGIICAYQNIFFYGYAPDAKLLLLSAFSATIIFIFGFVIFSRHEEVFVDMV